jgi:hypothetical protein
MSVQSLLPDLPPDYRETAFRAIELVLRTDPVLVKNVVTWRSREGNDDDLTYPSLDQLPLIALSPVPMDNLLQAMDLNRINLLIRVDLFVPGSCSQDILRLWHAVENAIVSWKEFRPDVPGQELVKDFLGQCLSDIPGFEGVNRLIPVSPAFRGVSLLDKTNDPAIQWGSGTFTCFIMRTA